MGKLKVKKAKPLPEQTFTIDPSWLRVKLVALDMDNLPITIYMSSKSQIYYLPPDKVNQQIESLFDCGVAFPEEEVMMFGSKWRLEEENFLEYLLIESVVVERADTELDQEALIFPGNYMTSLEAYLKMERIKELCM